MTPSEFAAHRKSLGLTQADLADILGVSMKTVTNIEAGASQKFRLYELALRGLAVERGVVTA